MWNPWRNGPSGWIYLAMLGAGLHRVAGAAAEDVRRARRSRGARSASASTRSCLLALRARPVLLGMSARVLHPGLLARIRAGAAAAVHARPAVLGRRARPGGGVLRRGQRRGRDPVHAGDVAVAGSLQALRQPRRDRSAGRDRRARRVGRRRAIAAVVVAMLSQTSSTRSASSTRCSASACSCRSSPGCICAGAGRSKRWPRLPAASSTVVAVQFWNGGDADRPVHAGDVRAGRRAGGAFGAGLGGLFPRRVA